VSQEHPYPQAEKDMITTLVQTLERLVDRDPDQEVQEFALPVMDAVIEAVRRVLPDHPVVKAARSVISPEQIQSGQPVRAADALVVATQLDTALGSPPLSIPVSPSSMLPPFPDRF
jgi:hypothetical protein